jgi:hypothetical protein
LFEQRHLMMLLKTNFIANTFVIFFFQEFLVKSSDQIELMGMMGLFGTLISVCQMYPLI